MKTNFKKGQGAVDNVMERFSQFQLEEFYEDLLWEKSENSNRVELIEVFPKTIVNKVKGISASMDYSLNPYQGCEHGCSYCYARASHEYWSYNAGVDFERKILYKSNAVKLLKKFFGKRGYVPKPITMSGNTDCYQPVESKLKITRSLLETFLEHKHPVQFITKNALILRDLDILQELAKYNLVSIALSINSLDEGLWRVMEPRTSTIRNRLKAMEVLVKNKIPVFTLIGPVIPALNSSDIIPIMEKTSALGSFGVGFTLVRLNYTVEPVFTQWVETHFPDRASKVLNQIRAMHEGELGNLKNYSKRGGTGNIADAIKQSFVIGKNRYYPNPKKIELDTSLFIPKIDNQLRLF